MTQMKTFALVLLAALSFTPAGAQDFPNEPHEFLVAKQAAQDGRYDEALQRLERILTKTPDDPVLRYERAMILIDAGQVDKAEAELRAVLVKNPDFYDANRVLGRVLLDRGTTDKTRVEEALRYLQAAFKAYPDDFSTGMAVSHILINLERMPEAERVLATMVERAPDQRALNFQYAQVLTKLGRGSESRQYLERAVTVDPTFGPAIMQLIDMYQQENEWDK